MHENSYPMYAWKIIIMAGIVEKEASLSKVYHLSCNPPTFLLLISPFLLINGLLLVEFANKKNAEKAVLREYRVCYVMLFLREKADR
jgi:hypothetical protein